MPDSGRWLKGCALGCAIPLVLFVLVIGFSFVAVKHAGDKSIRTRQTVEQTYPATEDYTPPVTGGIAPDRIRRFLAVRETLFPYCDRFTRYSSDFRRMEHYEDEEDDPPVREIAPDVGRALKGMFGVARHLSTYLITRNETLLANEMGLGEYTWIHVMGYYGWLGQRPEPFMLEDVDYPRVLRDRVAPQVREMIRRHVTELEAASAEVVAASGGSGGGELHGRLTWWRDELAALDADTERVPCADGVPPEIESSLLPFRAEFERLNCPATHELDLTLTEREGLGYEHR